MNIVTLALASTSHDEVEYKVWVSVERIASRRDGEEEYEDIGLPDPLAVFDTLRDAEAFVRTLPGWVRDGSDHRE